MKSASAPDSVSASFSASAYANSHRSGCRLGNERMRFSSRLSSRATWTHAEPATRNSAARLISRISPLGVCFMAAKGGWDMDGTNQASWVTLSRSQAELGNALPRSSASRRGFPLSVSDDSLLAKQSFASPGAPSRSQAPLRARNSHHILRQSEGQCVDRCFVGCGGIFL